MIEQSMVSPVAAPCVENLRGIFTHRLVRLRHQAGKRCRIEPVERNLCSSCVATAERLIDRAPAVMFTPQLTLGDIAQSRKKGLAGRLNHLGRPLNALTHTIG